MSAGGYRGQLHCSPELPALLEVEVIHEPTRIIQYTGICVSTAIASKSSVLREFVRLCMFPESFVLYQPSEQNTLFNPGCELSFSL